MLDFRNVNTLWSSILVTTLVKLGLKTAVVCPGSRSTPLTVAFANNCEVRTIPILDERSAAFFALGVAKQTYLPTILVCTSGTAGANFYPAIIEAKESRIPLIILTADRPTELRNCHAGQTIDQVKFYGNYPNWYAELAIPETNMGMLQYLRQNIIQAWSRSLFPIEGVVHLNLPFREPLAPIAQSAVQALELDFPTEDFLAHVSVPKYSKVESISCSIPDFTATQGIIIAGLAQPESPELYCRAIALLANKLNFPVLAEALSPLRNYADLNPHLIVTYDLILRNKKIAEHLTPEVVIQLGELPTSKILRNWLEQYNRPRYIIESNPENFDPLHGKTIHLRSSVSDFAHNLNLALDKKLNNQYLQQWLNLDLQSRNAIADKLKSLDILYEGKVAWLLSQHLPPRTPLFIANSMSVRNMEFFWQPNNKNIKPYFSRGANGIDGTLSTALGIADNNQATVLLTGDLALLHDTNGFLMRNKFQGHLTIIVINNNGGGIFNMLPINSFNPLFEEYFATPQEVDLNQLCITYGIEHKLINNWQQLSDLLGTLPTEGIRVLEIPTNRKTDAYWLQTNLWEIAQNLGNGY
ncbi:2-succinyl-5-enolpyruvyl-6-hydroxy-3-cyclohexene-1-carboxylic-acid synthase [Xenococcus sp. PCC 7305]|uniref:2-succinyl-5-enolpyruvyl-6-hydroxy-3- cyclohexene-1-carboxylic-acid synthase n=1 Tax=Xenococcus sp. PCC 7305 TaxID=102125 RepID=UPI0002AC2B78|nr:2-succinyl-5-enolpyruvyl-6-hydroxy-3-cyclohexene-1-carboxylic-acid synthase [Xenococcus sp. PCC 7305]ELS03772.1 2-succinyl-5-enolpyruvyl-6-hydroxy-3-cyclohexene-1-carboxylic-acid synthase [Xenococcus sp. PCC 7305]